MRTDEKEIAYIFTISDKMTKEDIVEFDYLRNILAKLCFEIKLKKEKLSELSEMTSSAKYPANEDDSTRGFLNFINNNPFTDDNPDGFKFVNEKEIMLAKKGVESYSNLEKIIQAIYRALYDENSENLNELINEISDKVI